MAATYAIYREYADDPSPEPEQVYLGDMSADTMADALELAAQYYEIASYDLIAVQVPEPQEHELPGWAQP